VSGLFADASCIAPKDTGTFVMDTDALDRALGAVLQQEQD